MLTTTDQNSPGRRPRRRSSLSQHVQRILHIDIHSDQRQNRCNQVSSITNSPPSSNQLQSSSGQSLRSYGILNYKSSDISSNTHSLDSRSSVSSRITVLNNPESRHSSFHSFHQGPQPPPGEISNADLTPEKIDPGTSGGIQRKDRRATKRLEAERFELEKRLLRLEKAERTGDVALLRRESRRLTKKQPLGSSSRSSSASGDESRFRTPSRLSSIFSGSRRRSRSRSSSMDGDEGPHLNNGQAGLEDAQSHDDPTATTRLSMTLPERLGVAISKELAVKNNALLSYTKQPTQTPRSLGADTNSTDSPEGVHEQSPNVESKPNPSCGPLPRDAPGKAGNPVLDPPNTPSADLDQELFAASLNSAKRCVRSSNQLQSQETADQTGKQPLQNPAGVLRTQLGKRARPNEGASKLRSPSVNPKAGLPKDALNRSFTEVLPQKHHRRFKSSPLAETFTVNDNIVSSLESEGSRLVTGAQSSKSSTHGTPNSINRSATFPWNTSQEPSNKSLNPSATASSPSQANTSAGLTKPRFYTSIGNVSGSSKSLQTSKKTVAEPQSLAGHDSPKMHQERVNRDKPRLYRQSIYGARQIVPGQQPRPSSGVSTASLSPESESEYDTADEATPNIPEPSDHNTSVRPSKKGFKGNNRGVPGTDALSNLQADFTPSIAAVAAIPSFRSKKKVADTKPGKDELVAKLFVICCHCKFWHDMPSAVYAKLTNPSTDLGVELPNAHSRTPTPTKNNTNISEQPRTPKSSGDPPKANPNENKLLISHSSTPPPCSFVQCCWCRHYMNKQCCQGWTTVVHMQQRQH